MTLSFGLTRTRYRYGSTGGLPQRWPAAKHSRLAIWRLQRYRLIRIFRDWRIC